MIYLGYKVTPLGILLDPRKVEAIQNLATPTGPFGVKSALGIYVQYRRFMPKFVDDAAVLLDLLKKGQVWRWTAEADRAWNRLNQVLTEAPLLARRDFGRPFFLSMDWSPRALGAVLSQQLFSQNGDVTGEGVIGYASRKLNDAKRNYSATEGKCLAVVFGIKFFRPYLYDTLFTVETDHVALRWLMNDKEVQGWLARWALKLMCYQFTIVYKKGLHHRTADALSRLPRQQVGYDASFFLNLNVTLLLLKQERLLTPVLQALLCQMQPTAGTDGGATCLTEDQEEEVDQ